MTIGGSESTPLPAAGLVKNFLSSSAIASYNIPLHTKDSSLYLTTSTLWPAAQHPALEIDFSKASAAAIGGTSRVHYIAIGRYGKSPV